MKAEPPAYPAEDIYGVFSSRSWGAGKQATYMKEILARIVDGSRFEEYRAEIGEDVAVRLRANRRLVGGGSVVRNPAKMNVPTAVDQASGTTAH